MIKNFSIADIQNIDNALYQTIDSIIYASMTTKLNESFKQVSCSKFTLQQYGEIASFIENKLNNNEIFMLKYYDVAKFLYANRNNYVNLVLAFLNINTYKYANYLPRTKDKFTFSLFTKKPDKQTQALKKVDAEILKEIERISSKTPKGKILNLCIKYYEEFDNVLKYN